MKIRPRRLVSQQTPAPGGSRGLIVQTDRMESVSGGKKSVSSFSAADVQDPAIRKQGFIF
jgi:hypothetical protein